MVRFLVTWVILALFWIALSGHYDAVHLTFGLVSVTLVSWISHRHIAAGARVGDEALCLVRLAAYLPWLLWQIALANVDVLLRVLGIRPVDPRLIRFKPDLENDFGRVAMANSITLTPGTVTVDVEEDGSFIVHAVSPDAARGVLTGAMERRVKRVEGSAP